MNHTYDSLRLLAAEVCKEGGEPEVALPVLVDALREAGLLRTELMEDDASDQIGWWDSPSAFWAHRAESTQRYVSEWALRWATAALRDDNPDHRRWSELRIAIRKAGGTWTEDEQRRRWLSVRCDVCGARVGNRCTSIGGHKFHRSRRDEAERIWVSGG